MTETKDGKTFITTGKLTITEALAEIKTIGKRMEKKRDFVLGYLARQEGMKDPLEKDGGSAKMIEQEQQALRDLGQRVVKLRSAIAKANSVNKITCRGITETIADWITWRREVSPGYMKFLNQLRQNVQGIRSQMQKQGLNVVAPGSAEARPIDIVVNISEQALAFESERLEDILGTLDGQLSLANAVFFIEE